MPCWLSRFPGINPNAPVQSRFPGYQPPQEAVDINTLPSGYTQMITGSGVQSPLPNYADPSLGVNGAFIRDAGLPIGFFKTHNQYIPAYAPPGRVGRGLFGGGAVAHLENYHNTLYPVIVDGYTVYVTVFNLQFLTDPDTGALLTDPDTGALLYEFVRV